MNVVCRCISAVFCLGILASAIATRAMSDARAVAVAEDQECKQEAESDELRSVRQKAATARVFNIVTRGGTLDTLYQALEDGAKVNAVDNKGRTPLLYAAHNNHVVVARTLLRHKAHVNATTEKGSSPLMWACVKNFVDMADLLLEYKADVDSRNTQGFTPLHGAAEAGNVQMVEWLLANNADREAVDSRGERALTLAAQEGHCDLVRLLLAHNARVNARGENDVTALLRAADQGHVSVIRTLLAHNADVTSLAKGSISSVLLAANKGHAGAVKLLLEHKGDATIRSQSGLIPLGVAVHGGYRRVVKLLLDHGVHARDVESKPNPLFFASMAGDVQVVRMLIDARANMNALVNKKAKLLKVAAQRGYGEIIHLLAFFGANLDLDEQTTAAILSRDNSPTVEALEKICEGMRVARIARDTIGAQNRAPKGADASAGVRESSSVDNDLPEDLKKLLDGYEDINNLVKERITQNRQKMLRIESEDTVPAEVGRHRERTADVKDNTVCCVVYRQGKHDRYGRNTTFADNVFL